MKLVFEGTNKEVKKGEIDKKCIHGFTSDELDFTIRVLDLFRYSMLQGDFDGWGLDDDKVLMVKGWLQNLRDGVYGK